jgi:hypothetical protein
VKLEGWRKVENGGRAVDSRDHESGGADELKLQGLFHLTVCVCLANA